MTYKIAQTEGKKNAAQLRKPNTTHCIKVCTGSMATLGLYRSSCETFKTTINDDGRHRHYVLLPQ